MMATYFHGGTEIQAAAAAAAAAGGGGGGENLQTLYLMNPSYMSAAAAAAAYSESHHNHQQQQQQQASPNNMAFLNQGGISPHQQQQHQLIGIPLSGPHHSNDHGRGSDHNQHQIPSGAMHHGLPPVSSRVQYNLWSPTNEGSPTQPGPIHDLAGQMGFRRAGSAAQGLSLSLSAGQQHHQHQGSVGGGEDMRMSVTVAGGPGMSNNNGVIVGSKYLRAAQELLEEVVNVGGCGGGGGGGDNGDSGGSHKHKAKAAVKDDNDDDNDVAAFGGGQGGGGESSSGGKKVAAELSTAQRQELQMKKAKLLNMLDEVEQRYKQYNTQIQVVVSSFEQAAGIGSAKSYTSLALKTISKQFRCLKDAITSQIKATSKSLGEDDNGGVKLEGGAGSRLRFVDHQLRQQRALQQLGMMQHNAWRPQRGLPERAVSVLRAWLFEHFLHPYPKDSDKHMLAKQTGLTRSQVSNWFINARVRLWKPMVEEMYVEEMKSQEQNGGTSEDNANTNTNTTATTNNGGAIGTSSSKHELNHDNSPTNRTSTITQQQQQQHDDIGLDQNLIQTHQNDHNHQTTNDMISSLSAMSATSSQGFTLIGSTSDMESLMARSPKKQRSNSDMNSPSSILSMDMEMKPIDLQHQKSYGHPDQRQHHSLLSNSGGDSGSGFNPYIVNDIGRFNPDQQLTPSYHGNAVSLTLGLPHGENNNLGSLSENHQQNFFPTQGMQLGRRLDIGPGEADFCGISMGQPSHPSNGYESIDIQNRKRFAAQILHDFVA